MKLYFIGYSFDHTYLHRRVGKRKLSSCDLDHGEEHKRKGSEMTV